MAHSPRQTPFVQIIPLANCLPGNSTTSFVQPSLDRRHSLPVTFGSQGYATQRGNSPSKVSMERASSSRDQAGYRPAICERRASNPDTSRYPYLAAEQATHAPVQPATRFEVASPKRKAHYVPATPSRPPQRVATPPGLDIPRRHSSSWNPYPSPPNSPPSERTSDSPKKPVSELPKQSYIPSPPPSPKRRSTPAPKPRVPLPSSEDEMKEGDELLSKFRRFALAARETPSDEKCIEDLMDSYDDIMPSLIEEVVVDPRVEFD